MLRLLPKSTVREEIDTSDDGPSALVQMKYMRRWNDLEVAVGMARRAYARSPNGDWQAIDEGCFSPRDKRNAAIGFNAVDGWTSDRLVAVGYKGEIWSRSKGRWGQQSHQCHADLGGMRARRSDLRGRGLGRRRRRGFRQLGDADIFATQDGIKWKRIPGP